MSRVVGHRIHGRIEVFAFADSIAEALALEAALHQVSPASAFQPVAYPADKAEPCEAMIERLRAENPQDGLEIIPEPSPAALELIARAEVDGSDFSLKAGEAERVEVEP